MADTDVKIGFRLADKERTMGQKKTILFAFFDPELARQCHEEATRIGLQPSPLHENCFSAPANDGPLFDAMVEWMASKGVKKIDDEFEWYVVESDE